MKTYDFEQRTLEWYQIRQGRITASVASKVITSTGKPSTSQDALVNELAHELMTEPMDRSDIDSVALNPAMQRGIDLEYRACRMYEFLTGNEVDHVGFCAHDDLMIGCSPDGLMPDGGLEVKCPLAHNHIGYLMDEKCPSKYFPQVQFSMFVTGRSWWDFISFHPDHPELIVRVNRDDDFISKLEKEIVKVLEKCDNCVRKIKGEIRDE